MTEKPVRVMLVDDQELIRTGFRLVLMSEPGIEVVAEAADGAAALTELERLGGDCDVVLMDVRMPGMNGIDATAAIAERFSGTRVLVLTTFDLDEYATGAIQAGASGFLLKDARPADLIDAIRRVAQGDAAMSPSVTRRLIAQIRAGEGGAAAVTAAHAPTSAQVPAAIASEPRGAAATDAEHASAVFDVLTERELDVLRLIAEGLNNAELSEALFLSESTVKTHVGRVLAKLQLRDRVHAVIFAKQHDL